MTPRYIVFCRKQEHVSELYEIFLNCLRDKAYVPHEAIEGAGFDQENDWWVLQTPLIAV